MTLYLFQKLKKNEDDMSDEVSWGVSNALFLTWVLVINVLE